MGTVDEFAATVSIDRQPSQQDSVVPKGWKPTLARPLPSVRCTQIKRDGERCDQWSLRGYHKCWIHSGRGNFENVNNYVEAALEAARIRIVGNVHDAVGVLENLMQPGTADHIRLKAATEVLDRGGIRGGFEIHTDTEITVNPAETLTERLSRLRTNTDAARELLPTIEGELVENDVEEFEQDTLF